MTSPRFQFPSRFAEPVRVAAPGFAFCPVPMAVTCLMAPAQLAAAQHVYQVAWERTQAALKPSKVEKLYRVSAN